MFESRSDAHVVDGIDGVECAILEFALAVYAVAEPTLSGDIVYWMCM